MSETAIMPTRRLSLECPVSCPPDAYKAIAKFVQGAGGEVVASANLHMTVLYIGRPAEIFTAVQAQRGPRESDMDSTYFVAQLRTWLRTHVTALRHSTRMQLGDFGTLGEQPPYAIVRKVSRLPAALSDLHATLLRSFATFLQESLGVHDGAAFLRQSSVFGYSGKSWVPHVTVGRAQRGCTALSPVTDVEVGPLRVRNGGSIGLYTA